MSDAAAPVPAAPVAAGLPTITLADFQKVELRTGKVLECKPHPNADKLLVLKLDMGGGATKQICSGIKLHYAPEQLVGRTIVVVCNLEPRVMRGEESAGMLLATSAGEILSLLQPDKDIPPGSPVR